MATHVRQFRTKKKINSKVGAGVIFTVQSVWENGAPTPSEMKEALEAQFGKGAGDFASFSSDKYDTLA